MEVGKVTLPSRIIENLVSRVRQMLYALNSGPDGSSQVLWEDGERIFCRGSRIGNDGNRSAVLIVLPAAEHPSRSSVDRLAHELRLEG